ncbi:MAG: hypothetical protein ACFCUS_03560 [Rubrimonas sp.]|uniref:hypothetical protein n=1 Tax=Rubrimonas sp. TaxID=2036015 RepID=UPI002FDD074B
MTYLAWMICGALAGWLFSRFVRPTFGAGGDAGLGLGGGVAGGALAFNLGFPGLAGGIVGGLIGGLVIVALLGALKER